MSGKLKSRSRLAAHLFLCSGLCLVFLPGCASRRENDATPIAQALVQVIALPFVISAVAQWHQQSTGNWPTNAVKFSEMLSELAWKMGSTTNQLAQWISGEQLLDLSLTSLPDGNLFVSYRLDSSSTNLVRMTVTRNDPAQSGTQPDE